MRTKNQYVATLTLAALTACSTHSSIEGQPKKLTRDQVSPISSPSAQLPKDLPADADRRQVDRQIELLMRGLYLKKDGSRAALPPKYAPSFTNQWENKKAPKTLDDGKPIDGPPPVIITLDPKSK